MRIGHFAYSNAAGVPGRWMQSHRDAGIDADLILEIQDVYDYGVDARVVRWSTEHRFDAMAELADDYDVLMVYDVPFYLEVALTLGKPILFRAMGSHTRREPEYVKDLLDSPLVKRATAGTGDLALALGVSMKGAPFPSLPPAVPVEGLAVHSPSNPRLKGTNVIEKVARQTNWKLDVVTDTTHQCVLAHKQFASLVVDQFGDPPHPDGLGVAGIEAMAMGLPVISRASLPVQGLYTFVGCPTIFVETRDEFATMMAWLRDDEDARNNLGAAGVEWVADFHDGRVRAQEDLAAL